MEKENEKKPLLEDELKILLKIAQEQSLTKAESFLKNVLFQVWIKGI